MKISWKMLPAKKWISSGAFTKSIPLKHDVSCTDYYRFIEYSETFDVPVEPEIFDKILTDLPQAAIGYFFRQNKKPKGFRKKYEATILERIQKRKLAGLRLLFLIQHFIINAETINDIPVFLFFELKIEHRKSPSNAFITSILQSLELKTKENVKFATIDDVVDYITNQ